MKYGGTWKGADKPAGASYWTPESYAHLQDCPACKFGTLQDFGGCIKCIDCQKEFTTEQLEKLGIKFQRKTS